MILDDPNLRAEWQQELEEVRLNMLTLRQSLADELRRLTNSDALRLHRQPSRHVQPTGSDRGRGGADATERGIYMVSDSRLNIAGLNAATVPVLARAIADIVA